MDERLKVQNGDQDEEILQSDHRKHLSGVSTKFLPLQVGPGTRIFSPHIVPRLCVTIDHQLNEFNSFCWLRYELNYRFEHIVAYSCGKVAGIGTAILYNGRPLDCHYSRRRSLDRRAQRITAWILVWIDNPHLLGSRNSTLADLGQLWRDGFEVLISVLKEDEQLPRSNTTSPRGV